MVEHKEIDDDDEKPPQRSTLTHDQNMPQVEEGQEVDNQDQFTNIQPPFEAVPDDMVDDDDDNKRPPKRSKLTHDQINVPQAEEGKEVDDEKFTNIEVGQPFEEAGNQQMRNKVLDLLKEIPKSQIAPSKDGQTDSTNGNGENPESSAGRTADTRLDYVLNRMRYERNVRQELESQLEEKRNKIEALTSELAALAIELAAKTKELADIKNDSEAKRREREKGH